MGTFGIHLDRTDGEHNRRSKLTRLHVEHLRASFNRKPASMSLGEFCRDWAALLGVCETAVQRIVKGSRWR